MTVSSDLSRVSYAGDGATSVFTVPFYFLDADDPTVILRDAAGAETAWTRGTHYTLSGAGSPTGGTLTVSTSPADYTPANDETLVILRRVPLTQETDYTEGDPLPAATLERDFDKARMIDQQLAETLGRTLKFADSSTVSGITLPDPAADQVMKWNAAADGLENWATVTDIAVVAGVAADIDTAAAIAAEITEVAGIAGDVTTAAANVADIANFADVYIGPAASDPTTRADASALQAGDLCFNTAADEMRVYDGVAWQAAYLPSASYLTVADNLSDLADAATARTNIGLVIGVDVQAYDADTLKADTTDNLTVGFTNTAHDYGTTSSGTLTTDFAQAAQAHYTNGGAHTLAPPSSGEGGQDILITNNAGAGTITTSGFDDVVGDDFDTTNGNRFIASVRRIDSRDILIVTALQ